MATRWKPARIRREGPGPALYTYVCTRLRVRASRLIPREEYLRLLEMDLDEITRFIEETAYKTEIDELSTSFSGIDLVEVALSWNMAKEFQRIMEITGGTLRQFTRDYLRRFDIQNVLTILRGKLHGISSGRIKEVLVPAGEFDRTFLDRLLAEETVEGVVEALKETSLGPIIEEEFPAAQESGSFSRMENQLYKALYQQLIAEAVSGIRGGDIFHRYLQLEIDMINIKNIFRLRGVLEREEIGERMIHGGTIRLEDLQRISAIEEFDEFIDALKEKVRNESIREALERVRDRQPIHEIELALTRVMIDQLRRTSKRLPFSIYPILTYLELKNHEVANLRALARGKEAGLTAEEIRPYLVM